MKRSKTKGFTLIELLVVIAIIGLLSSIILASLNTARTRARDAARKTDLHTIQTALELYYNTCNTFIVSLNCAGPAYGSAGIGFFNHDYGTGSVGKGLVDNKLTGSEIIDPTGATTGKSAYMIVADKHHYTLWATIEDPSAQDSATLNSCYFSNYDNYQGAPAHNYCISSN